MLLRQMTREDLKTIDVIEKIVFKDSAWSSKEYIRELEHNVFAHYYVLEDQEIIGYIGMWFTYEQSTITTLAIAPQYQGKHFSHLLMRHGLNEALENGCQTCDLEVRVSNQTAIALYEKYGFEIKAVRKNYYNDHEDAYLMIKERMDHYGNDISN